MYANATVVMITQPHPLTDLFLEYPDDVCKEGEELDLHGHKVDIHLLVEGGRLSSLERGLEHDGTHGERNELRHCVVHRLLVQLHTEHNFNFKRIQHRNGCSAQFNFVSAQI